jgi:hypothetical protein
MRHLAGRRGQFGEKAGASAFLHVTGKLLHGLFRDVAAFAPTYGRAGVIEREEHCRSQPQKMGDYLAVYLAARCLPFGQRGEFLQWQRRLIR